MEQQSEQMIVLTAQKIFMFSLSHMELPSILKH